MFLMQDNAISACLHDTISFYGEGKIFTCWVSLHVHRITTCAIKRYFKWTKRPRHNKILNSNTEIKPFLDTFLASLSEDIMQRKAEYKLVFAEALQ